MNEINSKGTILVVDDTAENISVLSPTLEREGYKVLVALNGQTAIERAKLGQPDLILLDIMMDGMDGFETCTKLKEINETKEIPVIFMTALADTEEKVKGFRTGAVDYVTKPYQAEEVLARVKTHITISTLQKKLVEANATLEQKVRERTADLEKAKIKAEQSEKLKSEFLAQMSHEVRTPINGIVAAISFIEDDCQSDNQQTKEDFALIKRGSERLIRTIDLIMSVSQLQSGTCDIHEEKFNLFSDILQNLYVHFKSETEKKQLDFLIKNNSSNPIITCDLDFAENIFRQLIDNAINFTQSGSIEINLLNDSENNLLVEIKDSGIGMSEDYLPKMFEPFSQEDSGLTRKYEGVGLGLTLVKLLCERTNLDLKYQSKKNIGTTFLVKFPKELCA